MLHKPDTIKLVTVAGRFLLLTMLVSFCMAGCTPQDTGVPPSFADTPVSLLLVPPILGNETGVRTEIPQTSRIWVDEETVAGWISPSEKILKFPVKLTDGAHLFVRLGVNTEELTPEPGDLAAKIEFVPAGENPGQPAILFEGDIGDETFWFRKWADHDIDLAPCGTGDGFLKLSIEGHLSGNPDTKVLWGQPAIYYPEERIHKNVLLIGVDTLRLDPLSVYGGRPEITPNIRRLSQTGTVFSRAWSQAPFTVPSFASMLTGLYPADLSVTFSFDSLPEADTTLAEMLLPLGFATGTICGNTYIGNDKSGFQQGNECLWHRLSANPSDSVDKAVEFIDRTKDRDWFLFLHFMDPHGPYDPPQEYTDLLCDPSYSGKYMTEFTDGLEWQLTPVIPPDNEIRQVRGLYDAEVADVDQAIGRLFDYLESSGMLEDTLVILSADHGEEFFEHGEFEHGQSLYEEMVHLPLIAWGDGFSGGSSVDTPVGNIDIAPSIFTHFGLEVPEEFHGIPLQRTVSGDIGEGRIIYGEGTLRRGSHCKFAVEWPYKCITDYFTGQARLFNLETDPMEREDISAQFPDITERLSGQSTLAMLPIQTGYLVTLIGDNEGGPERFTGTITVPDGIAFASDSGFLEEEENPADNDTLVQDGNLINFDISTKTGPDIYKAIVIVPVSNQGVMEVSILADGEVTPDRFYPYASGRNEPSGTATVNAWDLYWPNHLPPDAMERPAAIYILAIPGFPRDTSGNYTPVELDPETVEQLNALGYIR